MNNTQKIFDFDSEELKTQINSENIDKRIFFKIKKGKNVYAYYMMLIFNNGEIMNGQFPQEFIDIIERHDPEEEIAIDGLTPDTTASKFLSLFKTIPFDVFIEHGTVQKL